MKDETRTWLKYANENLKSARLLLDSGLFIRGLKFLSDAEIGEKDSFRSGTI